MSLSLFYTRIHMLRRADLSVFFYFVKYKKNQTYKICVEKNVCVCVVCINAIKKPSEQIL